MRTEEPELDVWYEDCPFECTDGMINMCGEKVICPECLGWGVGKEYEWTSHS